MADNKRSRHAGPADRCRPGLFGRLDEALISVGGTPAGTVATTTDEAWRSAFETEFLGAVRLARVLAADLGEPGESGSATGSIPGMGGSIVFVLASSVRVPRAELAISNGLFPGLAGVVKTLAGEPGPGRDPDKRAAARQDRPDRGRELDAVLSGDPDEVPARQSEHIPLRRCGEPEKSGGRPHTYSRPPPPTSRAAMIPVDMGAIRSI